MGLFLWVAAGGALGSVARFWLALAVGRAAGSALPWGTILVNVTGSLFIGWFAGLTAIDGRVPASDTVRAFVMVGICGGFTTFSSFSLQTVDLLRAGEPGRALANVALSVGACVAATGLGVFLAAR